MSLIFLKYRITNWFGLERPVRTFSFHFKIHYINTGD